MTPRQVRELVRALKQERRLLLASIRAHEETERSLSIAQHEEGGPGSAPGDVASDLAEEQIVITLARADRSRLLAVQDALRRIEDGSYGACLRCGLPIYYPRLRAIPWTTTCRDCAARAVLGHFSHLRGGPPPTT